MKQKRKNYVCYKTISYIISFTVAFLFSQFLIAAPKAVAATGSYQFDFGGKGAAKGYIGVSATDAYNKSRGFGFNTPSGVSNVSAAGSEALSDAVQFKNTSTKNTFNVDLDNGLYQVTVYLGNTQRTSIWAEDCLQIINMTGNNAVATVQIPITDGQLNIMATEGKAGYAFTMSAVIIKKISNNTSMAPTIWLCGDSTVCNYYPLDSSVQAGWGQVLDQYIDKNVWQVRNMASGGQYAKGFINSGQFATVMKYGKKGDIYFISIGINDTNYSNSTEYYESVKYMAQNAKAKGMKVILVKQQGRSTDISRKPLLTGRWFGAELDKIGKELGIQVIDLFTLAQNYYLSIGQTATTALYITGDQLHPNRSGALALAKLVAGQVDFNFKALLKVSDSDNFSVYIAGDSTAQSYNARYAPQQGWGFYLSNYLSKNIKVSNHAIAGRSSKSFYDQGRLATVLNQIKSGDYFMIQFGINDSGYNKAERYAPVCGSVANAATGSYEYYIKKYVEGALSKGAKPVLLSPVLGLKAYSKGKFENSYADYSKAMADIASYYKISYIDVNTLMVNHYNAIGYDKAKLYHLYGVVKGSTDMTHFCEQGANKVAELIAGEFNKVLPKKERDLRNKVILNYNPKYILINNNSKVYE